MGYYTNYSITHNKPELQEEILVVIQEISEHHFDIRNSTIQTEDAYKWYQHEIDMIELSNRYPEIEFQLDGQGEEFPDIWRQGFHNGEKTEKYRATITLPDIYGYGTEYR